MNDLLTITLTKDQLAAINQALMLAPYGVSAPVIAHINSEIQRRYNEQYDKQRETENT